MINSNSNVLVLKANILMKQDKMDAIYVDFYEQFKKGLVILPPYVEAIIVPKDVEVLVEKVEDEVEPPMEWLRTKSEHIFRCPKCEKLQYGATAFCPDCGTKLILPKGE